MPVMIYIYFSLILFCKGQIVHLDYGSFHGKDSLFTRQYLGIPYAAPPIGDLRFERPRPPIPFKGLKSATNHGKACYQDRDLPPLFGFGLEISEDCLNLNIWTPRGHSEDDEPLPVLVWLLPGGFTSGYVANPLYNGGAIVANSREEKSFNYRVGLFGWAASQEFKDAKLLNAGIYDTIAALEWVKKYIHKFGGDPDRVTAFGESAGGIIVSFLLLINNGTQRLFDSAIIESGPVGYSLPSIYEFQEIFDEAVDDFGCRNSSSVIQCLKGVAPSQLIKKKYARYNPYPVIDGVLVTGQPADAIKNGHISRVPIIIGTNTNEGTFFAEGKVDSEKDIGPYIRSMIRYLTERDIGDLLSFYPSSDYNNSFLKAAEIIADRFFRCPSMELIRGLASLDSIVYKYRWNHSPEILKFINYHEGKLGLGFHFSEIPFLFTQRAAYVNKQELMLSDILIAAWASFASKGNPQILHVPGLATTHWPNYTTTGSNIVFQTPVKEIHLEQEDSRLDSVCNLWSRLESRRAFVRDFYTFS